MACRCDSKEDQRDDDRDERQDKVDPDVRAVHSIRFALDRRNADSLPQQRDDAENADDDLGKATRECTHRRDNLWRGHSKDHDT